jgi:hypothetical protein
MRTISQSSYSANSYFKEVTLIKIKDEKWDMVNIIGYLL